MIPSQDNMSIRPANEADYAKLQELFQENDRHHARLLPGEFRASAAPRPRRLILEWLRDSRVLLLVCQREGGIVGCLRATLEQPPAAPAAKPQRFLKVQELIVARRLRNAGIGSALMAEAEAWARRKRARRVRLEVLVKNHEAVSFCDELGFETLSASLEKRI